MAYTTQDVMKLREVTGCGLKECKNALDDTNGDLRKAAAMLLSRGSTCYASNENGHTGLQKKERVSMRECKILKFYAASAPLSEKVKEKRHLKNFGLHYTEEHMQNSNNRLVDYPEWEAELNRYLAQGWEIQSMSTHDNYSITFLLTR